MMKYIRKIWVRLLLSLLMGGMLAETFHIKTGNSSIEISNIIVFIGAIMAFSLLSLIVWFDKYKYYFFPGKAEKENDILDDLE